MSAAASRIAAQAMKIEKVKEHIGAIVTGIDLAHPIDGATQKKLYDAVVENVVLVIRGQAHITPAQLQAAGEMFGELMEDQNRRYLVDGFPLISVLDNRHKDSKGQPAKVGANATWHTDHTNQELPPKFTMLYAVAVPDKGGATSVCNARAVALKIVSAMWCLFLPYKFSTCRFKRPSCTKAFRNSSTSSVWRSPMRVALKSALYTRYGRPDKSTTTRVSAGRSHCCMATSSPSGGRGPTI